MPNLKEITYRFTDKYLDYIMARIRLDEMGADATPTSINTLNKIRMDLDEVEDGLCYQYGRLIS